MVISKLIDQVVFLDTAPLIYFIEGHSEYQQKLKELFQLNDEEKIKFFTSNITLLEVLVKPLRMKENKIADKYKSILINAKGLDIFDVTISVSIKAAELRAQYNVRTPDAIQLATAIDQNAHYFLTNDHRLKPVKEINIITLDELNKSL